MRCLFLLVVLISCCCCRAWDTGNLIFDYVEAVNRRTALQEIMEFSNAAVAYNALLDEEDELTCLMESFLRGKQQNQAMEYIRNFVTGEDLRLFLTFSGGLPVLSGILSASQPCIDPGRIDLTHESMEIGAGSHGAILKEQPAFGSGGSYVSPGTVLEVVSCFGDWYEVRSGTSSGHVHRSLVRFICSGSDDEPGDQGEAPVIRAGVYMVKTSDSGLNVRAGAGASHPVITKLKPGTRVMVLSQSGSWSKINSPAVEDGWVYSSYLESADDQSIPEETGLCNINDLNVRSGAGSSYAVLETLTDGAAVIVISTTGSWRKIITASGVEGFTYAKYLLCGSEVPEFSDGLKAKLVGTGGILEYTRLWYLGNRDNVTAIYFCNHGDHNADYADQTAADRSDMKKHIKPGEGAIVAYPLSVAKYWPGFQQGSNGRVLLSMFRHMERSTGKPGVRFEQFSLSGGGRVNHALLKLINENYGTDPDITELVDSHLTGIFDGDSLCYSIDDMRANFITAIRNFPHIRFCFIHNTSGYMEYVHKHHNMIAGEIGNTSYPYGGSLTLQDGRLRFWAADTHFTAWVGQFERVFFGL
ncbi:MAG: SH3 domain-containing protein [Candidatus Wallbacteria bacterium]|nr:SH3 domain-containing protein [Candidatus Wallbacteria bacterium]